MGVGVIQSLFSIKRSSINEVFSPDCVRTSVRTSMRTSVRTFVLQLAQRVLSIIHL